MPAEKSAATTGGSSEAQQHAEAEGGNLPPLSESSKAGLMEKLGIPVVARERMKQKESLASAGGEGAEAEGAGGAEGQAEGGEGEGAGDGSGTAAGEGEAEGAGEAAGEGAGEAEGEEAEDEKEPKLDDDVDPELHKSRTKAWKQRKRAQRAEKERDELKTKLAETEAKLETASPIQVASTVQDPLAHITTLEALESEKLQFRTLRDLARSKPQGWVANEGTANEVVVGPEQAAQYLSYAEDVLSDHFPRKANEITKLRPAATQEAKRVMPTMFQTGTEDHAAAQVLWRGYPQLAAHPERDYLTAIFLLGFKADIANSKKASTEKNGKLSVPAAILKAHEDKGKVVVQKQPPPGRNTQAPSPKAEGMKTVLTNIAKSGGSRESLMEGLKALRGAEGPKGRDLAPV